MPTHLFKRYYSLNDLDKKLEKYLNFDGGVFFEAGANDGVTQSNTFFFERYRHWTGVLVEPIPQKFQECKSIRKKSKCYHAALVPPEWEKPYVELTYCNLMTLTNVPSMLPIDFNSHLEAGLKFLPSGERSYVFKATPRTISSILEEASIEHVDLMSIDLEGFEYHALRGLDLDKHSVDYLLVECRQFNEISEYLRPKFEILEELYLFRRRDFAH